MAVSELDDSRESDQAVAREGRAMRKDKELREVFDRQDARTDEGNA
jgi:hypothetical protein